MTCKGHCNVPANLPRTELSDRPGMPSGRLVTAAHNRCRSVGLQGAASRPWRDTVQTPDARAAASHGASSEPANRRSRCPARAGVGLSLRLGARIPSMVRSIQDAWDCLWIVARGWDFGRMWSVVDVLGPSPAGTVACARLPEVHLRGLWTDVVSG